MREKKSRIYTNLEDDVPYPRGARRIQVIRTKEEEREGPEPNDVPTMT